MQVWINADDYGWNERCSKAIFESFQKGWITTTTACANGEYFDKAIEMVRESGYKDSIGIHLNLTEGKPLSDSVQHFERLCKDGEFIGFPTRQRFLSKNEEKWVEVELEEQADRFLQTGLKVNHLDSHHFIHNSIAVFDICLEIADRMKCDKIRRFRNVGNISVPKRLIKGYFNNRLRRKGFLYSDYFGSAEDYFNFDTTTKKGIFEIMVHPDYNMDGVLVDRDNADYEHPSGEPLKRLIEEVIRRGDTIL